MTKILSTNTRILEIKQNEDGSLLITDDGVNSIENAGAFIVNIGGIQKVLEKCQETELSFTEYKAEYEAMRKKEKEESKQRRDERNKIYEDEYNELLSNSNGIIPTTYKNIGIVLRYLNTINWGLWKLPKMTIGYSCNQYDCDGMQASTMTLDTPIDISYEDELPVMERRFKVGVVSNRYLCKYCFCRA